MSSELRAPDNTSNGQFLQNSNGIVVGSSGSIAIGAPISGSTAEYVLYVDPSNNLANLAHLDQVRGGTGSDLSATGPGMVVQGSMGSVLTVSQYSTTGGTSGFTPHTSANPVFNESTFTGGSGSSAYTISDIIAALKTLKGLAP